MASINGSEDSTDNSWVGIDGLRKGAGSNLSLRQTRISDIRVIDPLDFFRYSHETLDRFRQHCQQLFLDQNI